MHLIEKINSWLLVGLLFFVSISTFMGSLISALIFILWLLHANFRDQLLQIRSNPVAIASFLFFCIHIVGLFWSDDIQSGLEVIKKNWKFFMLPIFMLYARKSHISLYINAFLASIFLSEFLSYLIWFEIIDPLFKASKYNPTVFMSHVVYNPLLAIAIYLVATRIIFDKPKSPILLFFGVFFLFTMIVNMFITGGRSGQIIFFVSIFIIAFQFFKKSFFKLFMVSIISSVTIFALAYSYSDLFKERMIQTLDNVRGYESNRNTMIGKRISFFTNGVEVVMDNPFFGVGTGDLESEMTKVHLINTPEIHAPDNPHNSHLMVAIRFGFLGLLTFLWIFYAQIKSSSKIENIELARLAFALPVLFLIVSFGDSYLSSHVTSLFYCALSAVIYARYEDKRT